MTRFLRDLVDRLTGRAGPRPSPLPPPVPVPQLTEYNPRGPAVGHVPATSRRATLDDGVARPQLFDPALKHYTSALRPGDPTFDDPHSARKWVDARRRATDYVLRRMAESPWGEQLVLRGSRLLRAWFGPTAREPGDLDWVATPAAVGVRDSWSRDLFNRISGIIFTTPPLEVEFLHSQVAIDDIWTYERAPGRRIVLPWRTPGLPGGVVQVDVVFGEDLFDGSHREYIPAADGGCVAVNVASPAQSLAWKLQWLVSDMYPQGKDLYDAVLLAERFHLPMDILSETLRRAGEHPPLATIEAFIGEMSIDWENFRTEYPWVEGTSSAWLARLKTALEPTFTGGPRRENSRGSAATPVDPRWLTSTVLALARTIDSNKTHELLPVLADALQVANCEDEDILTHLRASGPHIHGCFVINRILGSAGA